MLHRFDNDQTKDKSFHVKITRTVMRTKKIYPLLSDAFLTITLCLDFRSPFMKAKTGRFFLEERTICFSIDSVSLSDGVPII